MGDWKKKVMKVLEKPVNEKDEQERRIAAARKRAHDAISSAAREMAAMLAELSTMIGKTAIAHPERTMSPDHVLTVHTYSVGFKVDDDAPAIIVMVDGGQADAIVFDSERNHLALQSNVHARIDVADYFSDLFVPFVKKVTRPQ